MANWFTTDTIQGIRTLEERTSGLETLKKCIKTLQTKEDVSILDIGCAEGLIADWITAGRSNNLVGLEGDLIKVESAKEIYQKQTATGRYNIIRSDVNDLEKSCRVNGLKDRYDLVLLLAILQKLDDPMKCFKHAAQLAGWFLAVRVPDYFFKQYYTEMTEELTGWKLLYHVPATPEDEEARGHLVVWQRESTVDKLEEMRAELRSQIKATYLSTCDYSIVSFPKSGRTWIRYFLGKYLELQHKLPLDLEFMPQPYWTPERRSLKFPNIHFTHDWFDLNHSTDDNPEILFKKILDKKPMILLLRNPMDTIVSYYYHKVRREGKENGLEMSLPEFILDNRHGLARYCVWMNKMLDYAASRSDCLLISYEHMVADMPAQMNRMFDFMRVKKNRSEVSSAAEQSDFTNMQQAEVIANQNPNTVGIGRLSMRDWDGDMNKLKVRKGKIGSWQEESELDDKFMEQLISNATVENYFNRLLQHHPDSMIGLEKFVR